MVPFRYRGLLLLQLTGIVALSVATYLGPTPELGFIGVSFYRIFFGGQDVATFVNIGIGIVAGAAFAVFSALRDKTRGAWQVIQYIALIVAGFIGGFFVLSMLLHILPEELYTGFMAGLVPYFGGIIVVLIFAGPVIVGVYGLLMGKTDMVALALMSMLLSMFTAFSGFGLEGDFTMRDEDLTELFLEELEITIFSISFFVFAEIGLSVGNFSRKLGETAYYDRRGNSEDFSRMLGGVASGYVPYIVFYMALTLAFAIFSFSADTVFQPLMTESLKNAIEHKTIYGKILFTLILFGILGVLRGMIPAVCTTLSQNEIKDPRDVKIEWNQ